MKLGIFNWNSISIFKVIIILAYVVSFTKYIEVILDGFNTEVMLDDNMKLFN